MHDFVFSPRVTALIFVRYIRAQRTYSTTVHTVTGTECRYRRMLRVSAVSLSLYG